VRNLFLALPVLALGLTSACASETNEAVDSTAAALESEWGEIDEDATPLTAEEKAEALSDDDADDPDGAASNADPSTFVETNGPSEADDDLKDPVEAQSATPGSAAPLILAPPPLPKSCNESSSLDLIVYTEGFNGPILKTLADRAEPCSRYTVSVPKVGGSPSMPDAALWPRRVVGKGVRAYGNAFVPSAEVHWGGSRQTGRFYPGWKNVKVVKLGPGKYRTEVVAKSAVYDNNWFFKGVLFRQRMAKRGYRPQANDTWHINELESVWTRTRVQQKAIRDLVRGLAEGDQEYDAAKDSDPEIASLSTAEKAEITAAARVKDVKGIVFVSALHKRRPNEATLEPAQNALKQTMRHRRFWTDMNSYVSSFAVERYLAVGAFCKKGQALAAQSNDMAQDIMELDLVAQNAPRYQSGPHDGESTAATALSYLSRAYHPIINAAWGFGNDQRSLAQMSSFVRGQVQATRAFAETHRTPDNRIGIYFLTKDGASATETARFADNVSLSLNGAYDGKDGNAIGACGVAGADGCTCGD